MSPSPMINYLNGKTGIAYIFIDGLVKKSSRYANIKLDCVHFIRYLLAFFYPTPGVVTDKKCSIPKIFSYSKYN